MSRRILLQRLTAGADSTLGFLYLNPAINEPVCFIIEDEARTKKVMGETRIPAGVYEIKKREVLSGMTKKYREIYPDWFDWHLELQDVPNFKYVYIHHGNKESHTDGCLLCNFNAMILDGLDQEYMGGRSRDAFEIVYKEITKMLETERVFIVVKDEEPPVV